MRRYPESILQSFHKQLCTCIIQVILLMKTNHHRTAVSFSVVQPPNPCSALVQILHRTSSWARKISRSWARKIRFCINTSTNLPKIVLIFGVDSHFWPNLSRFSAAPAGLFFKTYNVLRTFLIDATIGLKKHEPRAK
jgi:hypothetical protein